MRDRLYLLDLADRFTAGDPDRARQLDASIVGLMALDQARQRVMEEVAGRG